MATCDIGDVGNDKPLKEHSILEVPEVFLCHLISITAMWVPNCKKVA